MSFTGDLEHLPIVDIIQLLHATRKSGTLSVRGRKGESQLVFKDGYIVSANHANNSVRIGNILIETNAITTEILNQALMEQENADQSRKPLIATLMEQGRVKKDEAFKCLETLIELTVVEILTWSKGTFALDVDRVTVSDDYRYFPENLHQEINLDTQNVLMDALRIYDEKMRDGALPQEESGDDDSQHPVQSLAAADMKSISADDLGLADLDRLERKIPAVFAGLDDRAPDKVHREKLQKAAQPLESEEEEQLTLFLSKYSGEPARRSPVPQECVQAVILLSRDDLLTHCLTTICTREGAVVFATQEEQDLAPIIDQFLAKQFIPILVLDRPNAYERGFSADTISGLRKEYRAKYPRLAIIQLASADDYDLSLQAFLEGANTVFPRPVRGGHAPFASRMIAFLEAFRAHITGYSGERGRNQAALLAKAVSTLRTLREPAEIALVLLQFVAEIFERALTLIVSQDGLTAEKSIGVKTAKETGVSPPLGVKIPLVKPSLFNTVIEGGSLYFGTCSDEAITRNLHTAIGSPAQPLVLLLPMRMLGRTIAFIYGDFGNREQSQLLIEHLEILAHQAELALENAYYRKKTGKPPA